MSHLRLVQADVCTFWLFIQLRAIDQLACCQTTDCFHFMACIADMLSNSQSVSYPFVFEPVYNAVPQPSRHRANFRYFSRTRAPSILLMNKLIRPVVQCGPTSFPRSSRHRRFGSLVFAQVQALDFGLFHSVEFSHMLYVVVMVQPGTWGTIFCFQGGAISSFQPESW